MNDIIIYFIILYQELRTTPAMTISTGNLSNETESQSSGDETDHVEDDNVSIIHICIYIYLYIQFILIIIKLHINIILQDPLDSPDDSDDSGEDEDTFDTLFQSFARKWVDEQLTHHVSLNAAASFWTLAFKYIGKILHLKASEHNTKKIPGFLNVRQVMYDDVCPPVHMSFAFLNKTDNSVEYVEDDHTPLNQYQRNPNFRMLYEEAHIKVNLTVHIQLQSRIIIGGLLAVNLDVAHLMFLKKWPPPE